MLVPVGLNKHTCLRLSDKRLCGRVSVLNEGIGRWAARLGDSSNKCE